MAARVRRSWITLSAALVLAACGGATAPPRTTNGPSANLWVAPEPGGKCTRASQPSDYDPATRCTLEAAIEAATDGDVLLFKNGDYGTWSGTTKRKLTLRAQPGQAPKMTLDVKGECCGDVTIDGFHGMGGEAGTDDAPLGGGLTIRNSTFSSWLVINRAATATAPVHLEHNRHIDINSDGSTQPAGRVMVQGNGDGVAISDSVFSGGSADFIQLNASRVQIRGNRFLNIKDGLDGSKNHADPIQVYCGSDNGSRDGCGEEVIDGNYFDQSGGDGANAVAFIGAYDSTYGNQITNNVFRAVAGGPDGGHGIAYIVNLESDRDSIIRNNTAERGTCDFNLPCGWIALGNKPGDDPGTGTRIYDNVISGVSGAEATQQVEHNLVVDAVPGNRVGKPQFRSAKSKAAIAGFCLAHRSPGTGIASSGGDAGIACRR